MQKIFLGIFFTIWHAQLAFSDCYVDYKAKKDTPLRLHYGVSRMDASICSDKEAMQKNLEIRLNISGWTLLRLIEVFQDNSLDERKDNAGKYFLKY